MFHSLKDNVPITVFITLDFTYLLLLLLIFTFLILHLVLFHLSTIWSFFFLPKNPTETGHFIMSTIPSIPSW